MPQLGILHSSLGQISQLANELEAAISVYEYWRHRQAVVEQEYSKLTLEIHRRSQETPGDFAHPERHKRRELNIESRRYLSFASVAARDVPVTLWNFGEGLRILDEQVKPAGVLNDRIDRAAVSGAEEEFRREFPDCKKLRNHITHRAESGSTLPNRKRGKQNALKGNYRDPGMISAGPGTYVSTAFMNDKLISTHGGEMHELVLDRTLVARVEQIKQKVFAAFYPATVDAARPPGAFPHFDA